MLVSWPDPRRAHHRRSCELPKSLSTIVVTAACARTDEFVRYTLPLLQLANVTQGTREELVWAELVAFGAFETELSYLLSDMEQVIRSRSELAFAHLQRSIVVDETLRKNGKLHLLMARRRAKGSGLHTYFLTAFGLSKLVLKGNEPISSIRKRPLDLSASKAMLTVWS